MKFPKTEGKNLEGEDFVLPYDLKGEFNIVLIAFQRFQQEMIDNWVFYLKPIMEETENFDLYELPVLNYGYKFMSFMIDGGMRAGIPNKSTREHTITLYINKNNFKKKLEIDSENLVYLFLVDKEGKIYWNSTGNVTSEKLENLKSEIKLILKNRKI